MAKSKKNQKASGKNKNNSVGQQHINKETYFLSERIKSLPMDNHYLAYETNEDGTTIYAAIVRRHINGNKSFAFFMIDDDTGDIMDVLFEFNIDTNDLNNIIEQLKMTPFGVSEEIEYLIYSAEDATKAGNYPLHPAFRFAVRILEGNKTYIMEREVKLDSLGAFQQQNN